jgi:hypothetical protein
MFAGLNVLPKTTFATDYSYKTGRVMTERLVAAVIGKSPLGDRVQDVVRFLEAYPAFLLFVVSYRWKGLTGWFFMCFDKRSSSLR